MERKKRRPIYLEKSLSVAWYDCEPGESFCDVLTTCRLQIRKLPHDDTSEGSWSHLGETTVCFSFTFFLSLMDTISRYNASCERKNMHTSVRVE